MPYNIRKARLEDLPVVHELVRELAVYEKEEAAFKATLADYQRDFKEGCFEVLLAEKAGTVLGMAFYYETYSTWKGRMLYLEDFVVRETLRRTGVGQLLFEAFLEEAKQRNCRLAKWQVLDWNTPAINFYKKNNAVIETNWYDCKLYF